MPEEPEWLDEPIVVDDGECELEESGYYVVQDKPKAKARPINSGLAATAVNLKPKPKPSSSISNSINQGGLGIAFAPWRSKRPRCEQ